MAFSVMLNVSRSVSVTRFAKDRAEQQPHARTEASIVQSSGEVPSGCFGEIPGVFFFLRERETHWR